MLKKIIYTSCSSESVDKNFLIFVDKKNKLWMFEGASIDGVVRCLKKESVENMETYKLRLEDGVLFVSGAIDKENCVLKYIASEHYISPTIHGLSAVLMLPRKIVRKFLIGYFPKLVRSLDMIDADIHSFCEENYLEKNEVYVDQKSFLHTREERYYDDINLKISKKRKESSWNKENVKLTGRAARVLAVMTNKNSIIVVFVIISKQ